MIPFTVSSNAPQVSSVFRKMAENLPFHTAVALTETAKDVYDAQLDEMKQVFDRPTPFTLNSMYWTRASRTKQEATVGFREWASKGVPAWKYLFPETHGGGRNDKSLEARLKAKGLLSSNAQLVPSKHLDKDAYGNPPKGLTKKVLSYLQANRDVGVTSNRPTSTRGRKGKYKRERFYINKEGVFTAVGSGKTGFHAMLFKVTKPNNYSKRYDFPGVAEKTSNNKLVPNMLDALEKWPPR